MGNTAHTSILQAKRALLRAWGWDRMRALAYTGALCLALLLVSAVAAPVTTSAAGATVTMPATAPDSGEEQEGGVSTPAGRPDNDRHGDASHRHGGGGLRGLRRGETQLPAAQDAPDNGQEGHHPGRGR